MKKIKVAVFGAGGRMGQELAQLMASSKEFSAALGVSRQGRAPGYLKSASEFSKKDLKDIDVLIDFSTAGAFAQALRSAIEGQIPLVSGTTGLTEKDHRALREAQKKIPVLWAPNMSLGVAVLEKSLQALAALKNFDFQIEESHHRFKKDRPSGTALMLQKQLESVVGRKLPEPLSLRGGGIIGVHQVHAMGENESLMFEHRAIHRKLFAEGALFAARWLVGQKKGLYVLQDLLRT